MQMVSLIRIKPSYKVTANMDVCMKSFYFLTQYLVKDLFTLFKVYTLEYKPTRI